MHTVLFSEVTLEEIGHQIWACGGLGKVCTTCGANMSKSQPALFEKSLFQKPLFYYKKRSKIPKSWKNWKKLTKKIFFQFWNLGTIIWENMLKKNFPSQTFTEDFVWSAFYSKTRVFPTFLKRGWLEIAHIRSTCGPDLPRASRALRMDAWFRQGLPRKKVRCASVHHRRCDRSILHLPVKRGRRPRAIWNSKLLARCSSPSLPLRSPAWSQYYTGRGQLSLQSGKSGSINIQSQHFLHM